MAKDEYNCKCGSTAWIIRDGDITCLKCGLWIIRPAAGLWIVEDFNEMMAAGRFDLDTIPE